jgi:drug/metabolite transporter (DMT)-like permease
MISRFEYPPVEAHISYSLLLKRSSCFDLKTAVFVCLIATFGPIGDVLLRMGVKGAGAEHMWKPAAVKALFGRVMSSTQTWLGFGALLVAFVCYLAVLSWADYSFVQPATAASYVFVALFASFFLREVITTVRWAGVLMIFLGVLLVGQTPIRTTPQKGG